MKDNNLPLVSVPVIVYNSAKTVIDTLDSIYNQTYPNIELIVSDDWSTDNTVEICRQWIEEHKDRFVRTELLTVEKNTGISANCNRAQEACQGEWVKGIAGDDLLLEDCVETFLTYVQNNPSAHFLFSPIKVIGGDLYVISEYEKMFRDRSILLSTQDRVKQLQSIIWGVLPAAPSLFYHRTTFSSLGLRNDENIAMIEDWPKWINILKAGEKFYFVNNPTVVYRLGGISTSQDWMSLKAYSSQRKLYTQYLLEERFILDKNRTIDEIYEHEVSVYKKYIDSLAEIERLKHTKSYRLGNLLLTPFAFLKSKIYK